MNVINTLLEISIYAAVIYLALLLLKRVLKNKMSPALHYAVWGLLIVRLIMPFTVDSSIRLFVIPDATPQTEAPQSEVQSFSAGRGGQTGGTNGLAQTANESLEPSGTGTPSAQPAEEAGPAQATNKAMVLSAGDILAAAWLTGTAVALVYIIVTYVLFRRRIRRGTVQPPLRLVQMFERCRMEMGIRQRVCLRCVYGLGTPALFVPATVLIPMELADSLDDSRLMLALRHELMHYKRRDHILSMLMLALQAVYWFNPFVWLAFRQMRTDMEVACDSAVTRALDGDAKSEYALLIVSMFSAGVSGHLVLGMAQGDSKKVAEKRIRGIFAKSRSKRSAVLAAVMLAAMLALTCFTTACQPTPAEPIVQSKNNDTVQRAIENSTADEAMPMYTFAAPQVWQTESHDDLKNIDVFVDASVHVPIDTWGIYHLMPSTMTEKDLNTILTAIVGDATIYGENTLRSKEYLLEQITHLEAQKVEFERLLYDGGVSIDDQLAQEAAGVQPLPESPAGGPQSIKSLSDEDLKLNIENFTQMINEAKEALTTAPDEETVVQNAFNPADMFREDLTADQAHKSGFEYNKVGSITSMSLGGIVDVGNKNPGQIYLSLRRGDNNGFNLNFTSYDDYEQGFFDGKPYAGQELFKCDISAKDAAQIARDKVAEMGFGYLDIDTTNVCEMLDRQRKEGDKFPECFEFVFTRAMDGATVTNAHGDGVWTEEKELAFEYAPYWDVGEVTVHVDDNGVIGISIDTPKSDVSREAYGIELMDLDAIMDIFTRQLAIENAFMYDSYPENATHREVHIDEIRLGYMPTAWKDHSGELIFTPVWDFFGYENVTYEEGTGAGGDFAEFLDDNNQRTYDLGTQSLLTINAMDGTIMLRQ